MSRIKKAAVLSAITAATLLLAPTLSGCSTNSSDPGSSVKSLNVWFPSPFGGETTSSEKASWNEILKPFEKKNDVKINLTLIPWSSYEEKYLTGVSSGEGPDVGYMYTEMMGDYITNGALVPFDKYLSTDAKSKMLYLDQGKLDGKQYAMPFVVGGMRVLYANTDILKEAGVSELPKTWDDFTADSTKVKDAGFTPLLEEWGAPDRGMLNSAFFPLLWQAGGRILTKDGSKTAFNSKAGLAAANYIKSLLDSGAMPSTVTGLTQDDVKKAFFAGKTAFMYGTDATRTEIKDAGINADFVPSLKDKTEGTFVASDSLVLLKACKNKQLCTKLVEFILGGKQMTAFHKEIVSYPPVATDETGDGSNPFIAVYQKQADILHSLPIAAGSAKVYNSLYKNLQKMILGQETPEQALKDAATDGDAALKDAQ